jgi:hypothetical protein
MRAGRRTAGSAARTAGLQAATRAMTLRSRISRLVCWYSCGPSGPPLVAEADGLRGLSWSRGASGFGLFRPLHGSTTARIQPVARAIARPSGC